MYPRLLKMKNKIKNKGDSLISKMPHAWVLADRIRRKGDMGRLIFTILCFNRCKYRMNSNLTIIINLIFLSINC